MSNGLNVKMDCRCPRQLEDMPTKWCELAVLRLKAVRNAGGELSEEDEAKLPGCPWSVDHQLANYCFFKYISEFGEDKAPSDIEIAALMNVSVDTVKKLEKSGLTKIREDESFKAIKELHGDEPIVVERDDSFTILK